MGYWLWAIGYRVLGIGYWVSVIGYWLSDMGEGSEGRKKRHRNENFYAFFWLYAKKVVNLQSH